MRILVVEDDPSIGYVLETLLNHQNYAVEVATDGLAAWELAEAFEYDLILLDVILPKLDGVTLCRRLREQGKQMPILLLTGRGSGHDKAVGLDAGADDYVVKPFDPEELAARVRALLRRGGSGSPILAWRGLRLDPQLCEVTYQGTVLPLTPKEYALLELFLRHPDRVFSCTMILDHLWSYGEAPGEEAVRTHVKGLRQKLKAALAAKDMIETVYGLGYRLRAVREPDPASLASQPDITTVPNPQQTLGAIANLWEKGQPRLQNQLQILNAAALALAQDPQEQQLRAEAAKHAHALIGSLGMLGLSIGSQIAQRLEERLTCPQDFTPDELVCLHQDVTVLEELIAQHGMLPEVPSAGVAPQANSSLAQSSTPPARRSQSQYADSSILVIDDSPELLELLILLLEPWGLHVQGLNDPRHLWSHLKVHRPDLLMLDVKMPHINGVELCQQVRQNPRWQQLPIVFLTGHAGPELVDRVFAAGADDLVTKPFGGPDLVVRILNRLERVRDRQGRAFSSPTDDD